MRACPRGWGCAPLRLPVPLNLLVAIQYYLLSLARAQIPYCWCSPSVCIEPTGALNALRLGSSGCRLLLLLGLSVIAVALFMHVKLSSLEIFHVFGPLQELVMQCSVMCTPSSVSRALAISPLACSCSLLMLLAAA